MTISVSCHCGRVYEVPEARAGQRARCKACGGTVAVPASEAGLEWNARPARPGRRPPVLLVVAVVAVVAMVGGVALVAWGGRRATPEVAQDRFTQAIRGVPGYEIVRWIPMTSDDEDRCVLVVVAHEKTMFKVQALYAGRRWSPGGSPAISIDVTDPLRNASYWYADFRPAGEQLKKRSDKENTPPTEEERLRIEPPCRELTRLMLQAIR